MMISYAQNGEDVLLRRLFPDVRDGLFIDVGANDPVDLSVTKHFYEQGWHGVNVEPLRQAYQRLCAERPRDRNLNVGVGRSEGSLTFYELPESPVLSTFSAEQAAQYRTAGKAVVERSVPVQSLASICEAHVDRPIHFLSIDVEGWEQPVLEGADWTRWRPMVVLIEATRPNTTVPTHEAWEPLLLRAGYLFAYFDGLNRFYVRAENPQLLEGFRVPVNICDDYTWYPHQRQLATAREQLATAREQLATAREQLATTQGHLEAALGREAELLKCLRAREEQVERLNARLAPYLGVGPTAIRLGHLLRESSRRFPRLAGTARLMLRGSAQAYRRLVPPRAA